MGSKTSPKTGSEISQNISSIYSNRSKKDLINPKPQNGVQNGPKTRSKTGAKTDPEIDAKMGSQMKSKIWFKIRQKIFDTENPICETFSLL